MNHRDMLEQAEAVVGHLLEMPEEQKDSELVRLKRTNGALHSLVRYVIRGERGLAKGKD